MTEWANLVFHNKAIDRLVLFSDPNLMSPAFHDELLAPILCGPVDVGLFFC